MPDSAVSPIAPEIATIMDTDRSVRVVNAKNPTDINIVEMKHLRSSTATTQSSPTMYHSTGINTQPPRNGNVYEAIYGRKPTHREIERNVGLAAIGRYTYAGEVKPHELVYGAPFPATRKPKSTYADSGFQTVSPADSRKALARAKVKASMMVNKYRHVTEAAGVKIYPEPDDDKVLHSEQFPTTVELDAEGNSTNGSIDGLFLPNIYGEDIQPTFIATSNNNISKTAESLVKDPKSTVSPPLFENLTPPRAVAALAPSLRPFDKPLLPIEDYGDEAAQYEENQEDNSSDEDYEGCPATANERSDKVDPAKFVVYDATKYSRSRFAASSVAPSRQSDKRKWSESANEPSASYQSKRLKRSHSREIEREARFQPAHEEPRHAVETTNASVDSNVHNEVLQLAVEPKVDSRILNAPRGPKADLVRHSETKRKDSRDDNRSRRRSRSPNRGDIDSQFISRNTYRDRDGRERPQLRRRSKSPDRREISGSSTRESASMEQNDSSQEEAAQGHSAEAVTQTQQQRSRRSDSGYETRTESNASSTKNEQATHPSTGNAQEATSTTGPKISITQSELQQPVLEVKHGLPQVVKDKDTADGAVRAEDAQQQRGEQVSTAEDAHKRTTVDHSISVPAEQATEKKDPSNNAVRQSESEKQEESKAVVTGEEKWKKRAERFQRQVQPVPTPKIEEVHKETKDEISRVRKEQDLQRERHKAQKHSLESTRSTPKQSVYKAEQPATTTNDEMMQARRQQDLQRERHNEQKHSLQPTRNVHKRSFDSVDQQAPANKNKRIREEVSTNKNSSTPRSRRPTRAEVNRYVPPTSRNTRNDSTSSNHRNEAGHGQMQSKIREVEETDRSDERRKKRKY